MLKAGAPTGCKPGAADATFADWISRKESWDAPASGATSPRRSVGAPAPGVNAPGFIVNAKSLFTLTSTNGRIQ